MVRKGGPRLGLLSILGIPLRVLDGSFLDEFEVFLNLGRRHDSDSLSLIGTIWFEKGLQDLR